MFECTTGAAGERFAGFGRARVGGIGRGGQGGCVICNYARGSLWECGVAVCSNDYFHLSRSLKKYGRGGGADYPFLIFCAGQGDAYFVIMRGSVRECGLRAFQGLQLHKPYTLLKMAGRDTPRVVQCGTFAVPPTYNIIYILYNIILY